MLENRNAIKLSKLVENFINQNDLNEKIIYEKIRTNWNKITNESFANNVIVDDLQNGVLNLKSDIATWRVEIKLHQTEILSLVNNFIGFEAVKSVEIH